MKIITKPKTNRHIGYEIFCCVVVKLYKQEICKKGRHLLTVDRLKMSLQEHVTFYIL